MKVETSQEVNVENYKRNTKKKESKKGGANEKENGEVQM